MAYTQYLTNLHPQHKFFIGLDSDGCVFDTMEIKHKECFCPNIIKHWGLQSISKYARQAAEFINLYSQWRGANRWPALVKVFDLLRERPEVQARNVMVPKANQIRSFIESDFPKSNAGLLAYMEVHLGEELNTAMAWSQVVDKSIAEMVKGVPPFPFVKESLSYLQTRADMIVVSGTPVEALIREWIEHDLAKYVRAIAGQEMGKKSEHLTLAAKDKYPPEKILMIGDAPGDLQAVQQVGGLFYPINPGDEERSWERFNKEAMHRFLDGTYAGAYAEALHTEFMTTLPATPPWS